MPITITLPPNLCADKSYFGKSVYWVDYCSKSNRLFRKHQQPKKTGTKRIKRPATASYPLSDHYPPPSIKGEDSKNILANDYHEKNKDKKEVTFDVQSRPGTAPPQLSRSNSPRRLTTEKDYLTLADAIPGSMVDIRKSWEKEASATKRDRAVMQSMACRDTNKQINQGLNREKLETKKILPGLDKWLMDANEYEKQVVFSFMTTLSDSKSNDRPQSAPVNFHANDQQGKRVMTPSGITRPRSTPIRMSNSPLGTFRPKSSSPSSGARSHDEKRHQNGNTTKQLRFSASALNKRINSSNSNKGEQSPAILSPSPSYRNYHSNTPRSTTSSTAVHHHHHRYHDHSHDDLKCGKCRSHLVKDIAKELRRQLKRETQRNELTLTKEGGENYPVEEDYVHGRSMFSNNGRDLRGHFIVHPDWVSEYKR